MIKAAIFDMDGILLDTEKLYNRFWCQASREFGYDMQFDHALQIRSMSAEFAIPKLESIFKKEFAYYQVKQRRIDLMNQYIDENGVEKKKGVDDFLRFLKSKGIPCAVATSSDKNRTRKYLGMVDLYDKFDVIVCGDDIKRSKPQPDIYITAAEKLGYKTEECVAFEDSFNGIKSAYTAGCKVIMVPDLDEPDEEAKKMLYAKVENIYDAKDIIKKSYFFKQA